MPLKLLRQYIYYLFIMIITDYYLYSWVLRGSVINQLPSDFTQALKISLANPGFFCKIKIKLSYNLRKYCRGSLTVLQVCLYYSHRQCPAYNRLLRCSSSRPWRIFSSAETDRICLSFSSFLLIWSQFYTLRVGFCLPRCICIFHSFSFWPGMNTRTLDLFGRSLALS